MKHAHQPTFYSVNSELADFVVGKIVKSTFLKRFVADYFSQNFYSALCSNEILIEDISKKMRLTWRQASNLISEIRAEVGVNDRDNEWYCSGINDVEHDLENLDYVKEGTITEEVCNCMKEIGLTAV